MRRKHAVALAALAALLLAAGCSGAQRQVPGDCVFVMGDNRASSRDSRAFGPVSLGSVIGRVTE